MQATPVARPRRSGALRRPVRRVLAPLVLLLVGLAVTGCAVSGEGGAATGDGAAAQALRLGFPDPITYEGREVLDLYVGSWIAALVVGLGVWGLMFIAAVKYRKKNDDLPRQVRYNLPIEVLYTVLPFVIVAVLFYYTAVVQEEVEDRSPNPDVTVGVIAFQWNWRFVHDAPDPADRVEVLGRPGEPPVLYLPTERSIQFLESSPDVIHSFWVPEFLFKRDVIPGRVNSFEVTIPAGSEGSYIGRCAEFCGTDHDRMNFEVRVVPGDEYDDYLAAARAAGGELGGDPNSPATGGTGTAG